jgi:hypothetical protein
VDLRQSASAATNGRADSVNDVGVRSAHTPTLLPLPFSELSHHSVQICALCATICTEWEKWRGLDADDDG